MAILLRGMEPDELATWTKAMIESGERLDLSSIDAADGRQALDRRRGRQGVVDPRPPGCCVRRRSSDAVG